MNPHRLSEKNSAESTKAMARLIVPHISKLSIPFYWSGTFTFQKVK
jgi:hypothetical protein